MKNSMRGAGHRATGMRRAGDGGALLVGALLALALLLLAIDPAAAWVCVKGVNTPVDLAGRDAACLSLDGRGCRWLPSREECAAAALEAPEDAKSLVCGDMMQKLYGHSGYANGSWCSIARTALSPAIKWPHFSRSAPAPIHPVKRQFGDMLIPEIFPEGVNGPAAPITTTEAPTQSLASLAAPTTTSTATPTPTPTPPPPPPRKMHYGVALQFGYDTVRAYISRVGFIPTVWTTYERISDWFNVMNPVWIAHELAGLGQPWGSLTINMVLMSDCGLWCITDNGISQLAESIRRINAYGVNVIVIPLPEGNGYWFPYGNQPAGYRATFRKIVWGLRSAGINSGMVKFGWQLNDASTYPYGQTRFDGELDTNKNGYLDRGDDPFAPYYPGDDVVDWIGISAYHYGTAWPWGQNAPAMDNKLVGICTNSMGEAGSAGSGFDLHQFAADRGKPFAIFETAAAYFTGNPPNAGQRAVQESWWRQTYSQETLDRLWNLKMVVWFEFEKEEEGSYRDFRSTIPGWILDAFRGYLPRWLIYSPGEAGI